MNGEMFECPDCQENYTADGANPVMPIVLDCGHDLCRECAKKILCNNGVLCCPDISCQKKHERFPLDSLPILWALIKRNQNTLSSGMAHPAINKKITVYIKLLDGGNANVPINIDSTATVEEFMSACKPLVYTDDVMNPVGLTYKGREVKMLQGKLISDYGIGDKSQVEATKVEFHFD